jgi:cyclopropane-fatty-acyl-phospholipid synthase
LTPGPTPRAAEGLLAALSYADHGRLELIEPGGRSRMLQGRLPGPNVVIRLRDWRAAADIMRFGEIGFAEAYLHGRWDTPDLPAVLTFTTSNRTALARGLQREWWSPLAFWLRGTLRSPRSVHADYDLGNDFYRRWLDPTMTYSSALFEGDRSRALQDAQHAKYERILQLLDAQPGERVLDIGCGWGGFAEYAASTRGCRVSGISISRRALVWAQERIRRRGLAHLVSLELRDYRDVQGVFDHVVSIEMVEAVGMRSWPLYFDVIARGLKRGGRAALQAIVLGDEPFAHGRRSDDFIRQYIAPRGMPARAPVLMSRAREAGLEVCSLHAFGADYAETLRRWQQRFNRAWPQIQRPGLDARFRRLWNYYLAYCEAGFRAGTTGVVQAEMRHAGT